MAFEKAAIDDLDENTQAQSVTDDSQQGLMLALLERFMVTLESIDESLKVIAEAHMEPEGADAQEDR